MRELLKDLCALDAIAGREEPIRAYIAEKAAPYAESIVTDKLGNLTVRVKGEKTPAKGAVVLAAPMDEAGFVLTEWGDCGCVKLSQMDQMDPKAVVGKRFRIANEPARKAVISLVSQHLAGDTSTVPEFKDMQMDFGAISEERIKEIVKLGETAVFDYPLKPFGDGKLRGKALECRVGCAILLKTIMTVKPKYDTVFLFLAAKYIGHRGAAPAARALDPHIALVVDYAAAGDVPLCVPEVKNVSLGKGPALGIKEFGSIYSRPLREQIRAMADKRGIPWQYRTGMYGQSDAGLLHTCGSGAAVAGISVPARYALTALPVMDENDIENACRLTACFVTEVDEDAV